MEDIQDTILSFSDLNISQQSKSISSQGTDQGGSPIKKKENPRGRVITFGPNAIGDRKREDSNSAISFDSAFEFKLQSQNG